MKLIYNKETREFSISNKVQLIDKNLDSLTKSDMESIAIDQNDKDLDKFLNHKSIDQFGKLKSNPQFIAYLLSRYLKEPDNKDLYDHGYINSILYHIKFGVDWNEFNPIKIFDKSEIIEIASNYIKYSAKYSDWTGSYWTYYIPHQLIKCLIENNEIRKGDLDKLIVDLVNNGFPWCYPYSIGVTTKSIDKIDWNRFSTDFISFMPIFYNPNLDKSTFDSLVSIGSELQYRFKNGYESWKKVDLNKVYKLNGSPRLLVYYSTGSKGALTNISGLKKFYKDYDIEDNLKLMYPYAYRDILKYESEAEKKYIK